MKKLKLIKMMVSSLMITSVMILMETGVSAEWKKDSNGWWNSEGNSWSTGWKEIDGKWYYFNDNGYMKSGWILNNEKWYFLDSNGVMQTGIVKVDGKIYYLGVSGEMETGSIGINGKTYEFGSSGEAEGNDILKEEKAFSKDGEAVTETSQSKVGEKTVEINLEGNPTTGYSWEYNMSVTGIVKEDSNQYNQKDNSEGVVGSGGTYTWKFSALREGTTEITFKYRRPWEKQEAAKVKTYIFTVDKENNITIKEK